MSEKNNKSNNNTGKHVFSKSADNHKDKSTSEDSKKIILKFYGTKTKKKGEE